MAIVMGSKSKKKLMPTVWNYCDGLGFIAGIISMLFPAVLFKSPEQVLKKCPNCYLMEFEIIKVYKNSILWRGQVRETAT